MSVLLTPAQITEAIALYRDYEWSLADIAEHFGVSDTAIKTTLRKADVARRVRGGSEKPLRVKQCSHCLHFLPSGVFNVRNDGRAYSWCKTCTNIPQEKPMKPNPAALVQALTTWRAK